VVKPILLSAIGIHSQAFDKKLQQNYLVLYPNIDIKKVLDR
jgi:hypothetical protein